MAAAQRPALQRRAVESERAAGTKSVAKIATISLSEARPLQALVGRPNRGSTAFQSILFQLSVERHVPKCYLFG